MIWIKVCLLLWWLEQGSFEGRAAHQDCQYSWSYPFYNSRGRIPVAEEMEEDDIPVMLVSRGRTISGRTKNQPPPLPPSQGSRRPTASSRTASQKVPSGAAAPSENEPITIFLRNQQTGEETYFSSRYKSILCIVFTVFIERRGLHQDNFKFSNKGQTLTGYENPHSLALGVDVLIG
jgi:hypothetical protein